MKRSKLVMAIGVAVVNLLGTSAPASAASAGAVQFAVVLRTAPLGYVGLFPSTSGGIAVTSTVACTGEVGGKTLAAGTCDIQGAGSITGNCGLSVGTIWGSVTINSETGVTATLTFHISFQTAATAITGTGTVTIGGQTGPVGLAGDATPVVELGGSSCATGTQTEFLVVGLLNFAAL